RKRQDLPRGQPGAKFVTEAAADVYARRSISQRRKAGEANNYFKTPQHVERLLRVQQAYGLPELSAMVNCDTRVASTVTLFQKSILNYPEFKAYFQRCETYDDPTIFARLSNEDWQTMAQCEAVTHMR
ncbi:hypothetical protein L915_18531, partial [Phytophthora nicotianae]